jgi:hypothetical protein
MFYQFHRHRTHENMAVCQKNSKLKISCKQLMASRGREKLERMREEKGTEEKETNIIMEEQAIFKVS